MITKTPIGKAVGIDNVEAKVITADIPNKGPIGL